MAEHDVERCPEFMRAVRNQLGVEPLSFGDLISHPARQLRARRVENATPGRDDRGADLTGRLETGARAVRPLRSRVRCLQAGWPRTGPPSRPPGCWHVELQNDAPTRQAIRGLLRAAAR